MSQSLTNAKVIHVRMEERVRMEGRNTHVLVQVDIAVIVAKQVGNIFYLMSTMLIIFFN